MKRHPLTTSAPISPCREASSQSPDRNNRPSPRRTRSVATAINGSMVQDFADAKQLGQDMQLVKTGRELRQEGLVPDPIQ